MSPPQTPAGSPATSILPVGVARSLRFADLLPPETLALTGVTIIGVGSIGFALAKIFASMGIGAATLIDFDNVSAENLGPQQWPQSTIGTPKVLAASAECLRINPTFNVSAINARFTTLTPLQPYVFCCADSMTVRRLVFDHLRASPPPLFVDTRMGAQLARVFALRHAPDYDFYETTLFPDAEAHVAPCTLKSTTHCAQLAAALAASALVHTLAYPTHPYPVEMFRSFVAPDADYTTIHEVPQCQPQTNQPEPATPSST